MKFVLILMLIESRGKGRSKAMEYSEAGIFQFLLLELFYFEYKIKYSLGQQEIHSIALCLEMSYGM